MTLWNMCQTWERTEKERCQWNWAITALTAHPTCPQKTKWECLAWPVWPCHRLPPLELFPLTLISIPLSLIRAQTHHWSRRSTLLSPPLLHPQLLKKRAKWQRDNHFLYSYWFASPILSTRRDFPVSQTQSTGTFFPRQFLSFHLTGSRS